MAEVRACDPVKGWFVCASKDALYHQPDRHWEFSRDHYDLVVNSGTVKDGGACRVTLANGQRIIVRALSEERKAARRARKIRSVE